MNLVYLANVNLPDDWAHSVQIMKMCEAFSVNGINVTLVAPYRNLPVKDDIFNYYKIKPIFRIVRVPCIDLFQQNPRAIFFWIRYITFMISARLYLFFVKYDVLYTRELYAGLFWGSVFIELHSLPKQINDFKKYILRKASGLIGLTSFIKSRLLDLGINSNKIFIAHDAVRQEDFPRDISVGEARGKLGLDKAGHIFGYIGTLRTMGMEKGVSTAIDALQFLPESYKLYIVGGEVQDIEYYKSYSQTKNLVSRVIFAGKVPHADIPMYIGACDVVVAPFPANEHYSYYMSPLKIFEYMASKRPMVVTDLPSLNEILVREKTALFVAPEDYKGLGEAIKRLVEDKALSLRLSDGAYQEMLAKYTWEQRAKNIVEFMTK